MPTPDDAAPRPERPTELAILDATERLLADRPFDELAVSDIIDAAGVSRTSFYAHFSSRAGALAGCLRRVVGEIAVAVDPFVSPTGIEDPAGAIRVSLRHWVALATEHGPLLRTVSEQWPRDAELGELWLEVMGGFAAGAARVIEQARAAGAAPPGADAEALATVLMWGYEQVLHVALVGGALGLDDPAEIIEPLAQMMTGGAFGRVRDDAV